jgi:acyl-CoA reductase-like NAD-dependent aldehyde dehydrogenase
MEGQVDVRERTEVRSHAEGAPLFPEFDGGIEPSTQKEIDQALDVLHTHKEDWLHLDVGDRIALLDEVKRDLAAVVDEWARLSNQAKGVEPGSYFEGQEWGAFGFIFRNIAVVRQALVDIQNGKRPQIPGPVTTRPDGQVVAQVYPLSWVDKLVFQNTTAEVWMEPGVRAEELADTQANVYFDPPGSPKVGLVLGAGNYGLIVAADLLSKMIVEKMVVLLKPNPVNEYLGPLLEKGFGALIREGYLRIVYGGGREGTYLSHHPLVDEIHVTGSDKTYDGIMFGFGEDGEARKAARKPVLEKKMTGELGNVSPVIVVPGPWSEKDIENIAVLLVSRLSDNSGCNCLTPRVIVQHKNWALREDLLDKIGEVMKSTETRKAYYPGAHDRYDAFVRDNPQTQRYGASTNGQLPWTIIPDIDAEDDSNIVFRSEVFCSLFAETPIEANGVVAYIEKAVHFANDTLWGNLSATIIVHPDSMKDPQVAAAVDTAIADLRYRTIVLNDHGGSGYITYVTPWGGFPGNDIYDIQSGIGVVNNALMFDRSQKSVVRTPFTKKFDPTMVSSRNPALAAKGLGYFLISPSFRKLPGFLWRVMKATL